MKTNPSVNDMTTAEVSPAVTHKFDSQKVLTLARKHLNGESGRLCFYDAIQADDDGQKPLAMYYALRSLAHSVGILHADYGRAFNASGYLGEPRLPAIGSAHVSTLND